VIVNAHLYGMVAGGATVIVLVLLNCNNKSLSKG